MKLYVLACNKLHKKQQFVQGTHAAYQWALDTDDLYHPILVMLECPDIEAWVEMLTEKNVKHSVFRDSYYDNKITSIASTDIGSLSKNLKLM